MGEREVLTWETFGLACRHLARLVVDDGFQPDLVLSIARGGLFPAGALSYALEVKNLQMVNVEFYTAVEQHRDVPVMLAPIPTSAELAGRRVLIVDDVADTGATLALVRDFCQELVADIRIAVIYSKPRSTVRCHYVWVETEKWIDFPWSSGTLIA